MRPSAEYFKEKQTEPAVVLEAGVLHGRNAVDLIQGLDIKKLYLMDKWHEHYEHYHVPQIYDYVKGIFQKFSGDDKVTIICFFILDFDLWPDEYFDYIYLDNDHSYGHVSKEIPFYWHKLKKGGVLGGDNFEQKGVERAVMEFFDPPRGAKVWLKEWKKVSDGKTPVLDWWVRKR
jgi:hypothetical protein